MPITSSCPSTRTSTMITHDRFVTVVGGRLNSIARSTTGTTAPRRLITPRTAGGAFGTRVIVSYSRISFTRRIPNANSSPASWNERYWVMVVSLLEPREAAVVVRQRDGVRLVTVAVGLRRLGRRHVLHRRRGTMRFRNALNPEERHQLLQAFGLAGHLF